MIRLDYQDKKVEGKLIYQDGQNYYVLKDSAVLFIKKEDVIKIYLDKILRPTKDIGHLADSAKSENRSNK